MLRNDLRPLHNIEVLEFRACIGRHSNNANFPPIPETDDFCNARFEDKGGSEKFCAV